MSGLVHEHGRLEPYSLLSPEPMEADEWVEDVVAPVDCVAVQNSRLLGGKKGVLTMQSC